MVTLAQRPAVPAPPAVLAPPACPVVAPDRVTTATRTEPTAKPVEGSEVDSTPTLPRRMTREEIRDGYEMAFIEEPEDSSWASSARSVATQRIDAILPAGSALRSVDCRTSFCRIETNHVDLEHYKQFVERALVDPQSSVWNGATFSTVIDSNSEGMNIVSFVSRDGQTLPRLD